MNWRMGLIRGWVVFAVVWMAGVGAVGWNDWREYKAAPVTEISQGDNPQVANVIRGLEHMAGRVERPNIDLYVAIALGVPVALFGVGLGLIWVQAGFRRRGI